MENEIQNEVVSNTFPNVFSPSAIAEPNAFPNVFSTAPSAPPYFELHKQLIELKNNDPAHIVRCNRIGEIEKNFQNEIEIRHNLHKRYSRLLAGFAALDGVLGVTSLCLDIGGATLISSVVGSVIGLPMLGAGIALGLASLSCIPFLYILKLKAEKHISIYNIAKTKMDTIRDHCVEAMKDSIISEKEFELITSEWSKYIIMKNDVKKKTEALISEVQKAQLIKQGRQEAVEKLKEIKELNKKKNNEELVRFVN